MDHDSRSNPSRSTTLLVLCIGLWLVALGLAAFAAWLFIQPGAITLALLVIGIALLTAAASFGLYLNRRWGVVLFGLLGAAGSVNHIANAIQRFVLLYNTDTGKAVSSIISVLGAFLVPFVVIYLVLALWKKAI